MSLASWAMGVIIKRKNEEMKENFVSFLIPVSFINLIFCFIDRGLSISTGITLFSFVLCIALGFDFGNLMASVILSGISGVIAIPIGGILLLSSFFSGFSENTIVKTLESPNSIYRAEVINSDQGALGGSTFVDVYKNESFDFLLFEISKKPVRIYSGDFAEGETMSIYWKDDNHLVIKSFVYPIK